MLHLAAQVAVTTSLDDPLHDFDVNAAGTLNLLEALRRAADPPPLIFASTNKVYGKLLDEAELLRTDIRWQPARRRPARRAATSARRSTSTAPMAARRAWPTSTCSTMPGCSACRPSCSA